MGEGGGDCQYRIYCISVMRQKYRFIDVSESTCCRIDTIFKLTFCGKTLLISSSREYTDVAVSTQGYAGIINLYL